MLTAKVRKTGNSLRDAAKYLKQASPKVSVGVFEEQGQHPTAHMSYVELLRYHASNPEKAPIRDVLLTLSLAMKASDLKDPRIKQAIKMWASRPFSRESDRKLLNEIGEVLRDWGKDHIFGNPSALAGNAPLTIALKGGRDTPLVDDGHLRDAFAFKNSIDKIVQEGD